MTSRPVARTYGILTFYVAMGADPPVYVITPCPERIEHG